MASQTKTKAESLLQLLPLEVKQNIMLNLDISSLYALFTTCRHFYNIYKSDGGIIIREITTNALGDFLPSAIALYAARRAEWVTELHVYSPSQLVDRIHRFGRKYLDRNNRPSLDRQDFSLSLAEELISFHSTVEKFALQFMEESLSEMFLNPRGRPIPKPTSTEISRVQLTFYCMEISRELLPYKISSGSDSDSEDSEHEMDDERPWEMLWHYFTPWENRIAESITKFLDKFIDGVVTQVIDGIVTQGPIELIERGTMVTGHWYILMGLQGVEGLADGSFDLEFISRIAADKRIDWSPLRHISYFSHAMSGFTWLRPAGGSLRVRSLNMDHLLARFPQEENGACDNWYFTIISEQHNPEAYLSLLSGILWWDRDRTNAQYPGVLPSTAEIQDMAEGKEYIGREFVPEVDYCKEIGY
ncbi:hypothetical protein F5Y00DRAFT_262581 [Daldinia vernicosa]|uniref:uncharacterized protein n=1 Tax=Daldinia vernicosa TaxID=114800 RepID=UPI002007A70A|nr:uncharacterized protein F5Y00DRAFT_262581 [Daldinia vernicosa]KAI0848485.1 hypothetical protein F5Y00DRAFT_262581 [Daldinia vernicosa]